MNTATQTRRSNKPAAVFCDGPESDFDMEGDEYPVWAVWVGDEDGDAIGKVYHCRSMAGAKELARKMAHDRRLPLEDEAMPA